MAEIKYKLLVDAEDPILGQVKSLFSEMYEGMLDQGLLLPLAVDGPDIWIEGIIPTLGRFGILALAIKGDKLIGFAHGTLKFLPDYLGGHKTGVVTHIFVKPEFRQGNVGQELLDMLEEWLKEKGVHSIEIQVIEGNDARRFWEKSGYSLELHQYRKFSKEDQ